MADVDDDCTSSTGAECGDEGTFPDWVVTTFHIYLAVVCIMGVFTALVSIIREYESWSGSRDMTTRTCTRNVVVKILAGFAAACAWPVLLLFVVFWRNPRRVHRYVDGAFSYEIYELSDGPTNVFTAAAGETVINTGLRGGTDYVLVVPEFCLDVPFSFPTENCQTGCETNTDCPDWLGFCCPDDGVCEAVIGACEDPHMTGFRGQKFDFAGNDGEWYALVKSGESTHLNMRVTAPVPAFPHISYVTGISLMTDDADGVAHSIVISAKEPHVMGSSCPTGVYPCLADGSLSVERDGQEALLAPGSITLGEGVGVSAVNIPGECRSGGFEKYWEAKHQEFARHGRRMTDVQSMADWVLGDPTTRHREQCAKYVSDAEETDGGLFAYHSEHASFQIITPAITLRLNHGWIAYEGWRDPTDTFNYPDHETWQMNLGLEHNDLITTSSGVLGETFVPTLNKRGQPIMWGKEAIRGSEEDYHVDGPFGLDFGLSEYTP